MQLAEYQPTSARPKLLLQTDDLAEESNRHKSHSRPIDDKLRITPDVVNKNKQLCPHCLDIIVFDDFWEQNCHNFYNSLLAHRKVSTISQHGSLLKKQSATEQFSRILKA